MAVIVQRNPGGNISVQSLQFFEVKMEIPVDMDNVYFACIECKTYVDAGYRWAYWQLEEPKIVLPGAMVDVDRLLSVDSYWKPEPNKQNSSLTSVLSRVERFILSHKTHRIVYGIKEEIIGEDVDEYDRFAWMNEYPDYDDDLEPRNFIEQLGMRTWGEVTAYLASCPQKPSWYTSSSRRVVARRKFEELVLSELHRNRPQQL